MIGSGIFLLPAVLAPFGRLSFGGWAVTTTGAIALALVIARLASRTQRSGGVYAYAHDAFGPMPGFLVAWGYWAAYWIALPAMALAFVGYLGVFFPVLDASPPLQAATCLAAIWGVTLVNIAGIREAGWLQITTTCLKLIPLLLVIGAGTFAGDLSRIPDAGTTDVSPLGAVAATALLTMWAFSGLEAGALPAAEVAEPERTIPRAILTGTLTVAAIYVGGTLAVMSLVPAEQLAASTAPFAEAARVLGPWGPGLIAAGAIVSTLGALNGTVFITGQLPLALAMDGLAPNALTARNRVGAPGRSLILGSSLASVLLLTNYFRDFFDLFTFLINMSTTAILVPLFVSAAAELRHDLSRARGWAGAAGLALLYTIFTILGSGTEILLWGVLLFALGIPAFFLSRRAHPEV